MDRNSLFTELHQVEMFLLRSVFKMLQKYSKFSSVWIDLMSKATLL